MLGLLGRVLVGIAGLDSELQRGGKKNMGTALESARFFMCGGERVFLNQVGLTKVVRAVFPECLPFPEIERHAALGVDYHRE
jgi:hypothetical protein